ncbi:NAD(P)/FAD-dependent oxidoreductase [Luteibaculum oceani]|uniref:FAD-binding oxidoreductase n=1 Tax=Luteibaculum oceani TaxID=1294296 RepID=A0A5C6V8G2_9FLAO|nr:FAD-dependent oxidoreductase [Luteibaculum oceani]TXC81662.1 FAD-binding oxidoreductase [Luteibaculum oceani]
MDISLQKSNNFSYWEHQILGQPFDFIIIGGGFCGLYTALFIKEKRPKAKVLILEKNLVGNTASTKNAGFSCFGSAGELLDDIHQIGWEKTADLLQMRIGGLEILQSVIPHSVMDYSRCGAFEVFSKDEEEQSRFQRVQENLDNINTDFKSILPNSYTVKDLPDKLKFKGKGIFQAGEGALNPFKLIRYLEQKVRTLGVEFIKGVEVYQVDNTAENEVNVHTNKLDLKCQVAICTTNLNSLKLPEVDCQPARAQVIISKPLPRSVPKEVFHAMNGYTYFRFVDGRLLLGGMRHMDMENEFTGSNNNTAPIIDQLKSFGKELMGFPIPWDFSWTGTMSVGPDRFPNIGSRKNILYGLKMGGMGVAVSPYIAKKLVEHV